MKFLAQKILIAITIVIVVLAFIAWGKGYRLSLQDNKLVKTGILASTSSPEGAKVNANGKFLGATNSNFSLTEGNYDINISKDGLLTWAKKIQIKAEQVHRADPWLFTKNPSLTPQTSSGIAQIFVSPSGQKVFFLTPNSSSEKGEGLYLFQGGSKNFLTSSSEILILDKTYLGDIAKLKISSIEFSPNEDEMILKAVVEGKNVEYLLSAVSTNTKPSVVTSSSALIIKNWQEKVNKKKETYLKSLPAGLAMQSREIFSDFKISPDGKKILYEAKKNDELAKFIEPELVGTNQTPQSRNLIAKAIYVLDLQEDKNYLISKDLPLSDFHWYISSSHLVNLAESPNTQNITLRDFDNTNVQVVYNGPILSDKISINSSGDILTLLNFSANTSSLADLYLISIH